MSDILAQFLEEHRGLTRRYFLGASAAGIMAAASDRRSHGAERDAALEKVLADLESYLTAQADFRDVSRGKPLPHSLPEEKMQEVGLTRESWRLEVISDPENPAKIRNPLSRADDSALDWDGLMQLAETKAVSFPKVMTCNNIGCPLGMGIWEGVPLRDVIWLTEPKKDLRRVFYWGYHNDDPEQIFRSSLPIGRVLEDPFGLPPITLCYKLNGEFLNSQRGGPVRMVVPEAYGFKSVKWLNTVVLTNLWHANDTYANGNNDVDSWLKTFAATLHVPDEVDANTSIPVTGYCQVGIAGLSRVQTWVYPKDAEMPANDPYLQKGDWQEAEILGPPTHWGGELPNNRIPDGTMGFDHQTHQPKQWPIRLAKAHWATLLPGLAPGRYMLRCRTIDENGNAQPLPRPFDKSGRTGIERRAFTVRG